MSAVKLVVLDVDGVLTDGGILLNDEGREWKRFHTHDGVGVKLALLAGWRVLWCTARASQPARRRAEELGAEWSIGIKHKKPFLDDWLGKQGIAWEETAFVGDDLQDLKCLQACGWPVSVANGAPEVKAAARYVTQVPGGYGAVRDAVQWLLRENNLYEHAVRAFLDAPEGFSLGQAQWSGS